MKYQVDNPNLMLPVQKVLLTSSDNQSAFLAVSDVIFFYDSCLEGTEMRCILNKQRKYHKVEIILKSLL